MRLNFIQSWCNPLAASLSLVLMISQGAVTTSHAAPVYPAPQANKAADQEVLLKTSRAFNEVARIATPSVVSISAIRTISPPDSAKTMGLSVDPPEHEGSRSRSGPQQMMGLGSGVIIRDDGLILTSNHVVENAEWVTVGLDEKKKVKAHVLGSDTKTDIAVLQLDQKIRGLPTISFGNSNDVKVGDWAVAIGNPFGLVHSVTSGIISAKGRGQVGIIDADDFIQTDAAINPGNSGGPLLNIDGQMIGLNAAIFSQTGGFMGIGFAIPSNSAKLIADEIILHGRVTRGWIGVVAQDIDPDLARYFKIAGDKGALISDLNLKGPAAAAALQIGDVVTLFDGKPVSGSSDLKLLVTKTRAGSQVPIEIRRNGITKRLLLTVREQEHPGPSANQLAGQAAAGYAKASLGLAVEDVPADFRKLLSLTSGNGALVVGVNPGSLAFEAGITPGDVILKVNDKKIHRAQDVQEMAKDMTKNPISVLYIQRGPDGKIFVPIKNHLS